MVLPLAAIGIGLAVASAAKGMSDAKKSSGLTKAAGKTVATAIEKESEESQRRLRRSQQYEYGLSAARIYAGNLKMAGSPQAYLHDMALEQSREVNWLSQETNARMKAARAGANTQASNLQRTANTNMMASLGSLAMKVGV
jgi:hypothetical protein